MALLLVAFLSLSFPSLTLGKHHEDAIHFGLIQLGGSLSAHPSSLSQPSPKLNPICKDDKITSAISPPSVSIKSAELVTAAWEMSASSDYQPSTSDWIGFYCGDFLSTVPDEAFFDWVYVTQDQVQNKAGSIDLKLKSGRMNNCEFRFFNHDDGTSYCRIGVSSKVTITDAKTVVSQRHLALTERQGEMRISWTAGTGEAPMVEFSTTKDLANSVMVEGNCHTYKQIDMCEEPANNNAGFVEPGQLCTAVMAELEVDKLYYYRVTSDGKEFSDVTQFRSSPPTYDPDYSHSYIVYGDMGT